LDVSLNRPGDVVSDATWLVIAVVAAVVFGALLVLRERWVRARWKRRRQR
jgi:type II secretory pathway component PulF